MDCDGDIHVESSNNVNKRLREWCKYSFCEIMPIDQENVSRKKINFYADLDVTG